MLLFIWIFKCLQNFLERFLVKVSKFLVTYMSKYIICRGASITQTSHPYSFLKKIMEKIETIFSREI